MVEALNQERGIFLSSGIEYPGRYTRWDIGFIRPPLEFVSRDRELRINALNERGSVLINLFADVLTADPNIQVNSRDERHLVLHISVGTEIFPEGRTKFPTDGIYSVTCYTANSKAWKIPCWGSMAPLDTI